MTETAETSLCFCESKSQSALVSRALHTRGEPEWRRITRRLTCPSGWSVLRGQSPMQAGFSIESNTPPRGKGDGRRKAYSNGLRPTPASTLRSQDPLYAKSLKDGASTKRRFNRSYMSSTSWISIWDPLVLCPRYLRILSKVLLTLCVGHYQSSQPTISGFMCRSCDHE